MAKLQWEVYYITKDGFSDSVRFGTKRECIRKAKEWAKDEDTEWVEVRATDDDELIDDTEIIFKK